jgi:prepilin-type N-terminal cleavage/methylation domain-containing protein
LGTRKAFTLVETLVAIAVIAILLGISIPFLRRAIVRSEEVNDLVNLRSTHQQFYEWGIEHLDRFVNKGPVPHGQPFYLRIGDSPNYLVGSYGGQTGYWTWTLGEWLERGYPTWHPVTTPPLEPHEEEVFSRMIPLPGSAYFRRSSFYLSSAMLFDPRRFAPGCLESSSSTARFVRWSETAFPAKKVLLFNQAALSSDTGAYPTEDPIVATVLVDGSVRNSSPFEAITTPDICSAYPFSHTPLGILGRDLP